MGQNTQTEAPNGVQILDMALISLDQAIEELIAWRKDVERRLIDLKAEDSILENEIQDSISSGHRFLESITAIGNIGLEKTEGFIRSLSASSQELGRFADTVSTLKTMIDKNHYVEALFEELRTGLTESINNLENLKSLLLTNAGGIDETQIKAMKTSHTQTTLGSSAIIRSQEMERQRIAREIHDGPAQSIANVVLRLDIVNKVYDKNPASVPDELTKMKELAQNALNEIRGFIFDLRPMTLQDLGLAATIKRVINPMNVPSGTLIQFILEGDEREIHPDIKLALFRIAQECLNNMRKHAKAKSCWVHLKYLKDKVVLIIEDDGQGFDESKVADSQRKYVSFGLLGMRERADDIGGTLDIKSKPGEGTKVTLVIIDGPK